MALTIGAIVFAAVAVFLAWKMIKTVIHVAIIAIVLAAGIAFLGYHEIHFPKGIIQHGQSVLHSVEHAATTAVHRVRHGLKSTNHS